MAYEDGWIFKNDYCIDTEWHLLSYEWLNILYELSQYLGGYYSSSDLTTFWKYYSQVASED